MFDNHLYALHNALTPDDQPKLPPEEFLRQWTPSGIREMVFEQAKRKIVGENLLRLHGMDLPETNARLSGGGS